jgi:RNA polymerase sigma factor (sigma-70 family)
LVRRISPKISRTVAVWRLDKVDSRSDDVIDEILVDFYDQVFSDDEAAMFWEVRFWVCLERRLLNIVRRRRAEIDREDNGSDLDSAFGDCLPTKSWEDDPETQALVMDALARLSPPEREVFVLKHWCGYAEESKTDPAEETIASIMGVTGRTVRNHLARAEENLAMWRAGETKNRRGASANV